MVVIGGAGFIGSHLVDALLERGFAVRVIDNFATGRPENVNPAADLIEHDIRRLEGLSNHLRDADCVFHLAALPRVSLSVEKPVDTHLTNALGTLNVLEATRKAEVRRVVYASSSSVYGEQEVLPLRETMTPNPLSPYAAQKLAGEQYMRLFSRLYRLETVVLRYFNVYGPRMQTDGPYATVVAAFLEARRRGLPMTIYGDGEQTRDFTYVSDAVEATIRASSSAVTDGRPINVGSGRALSVNRIATLIGGPTVYAPSRLAEPRHTLADITLANRLLGWYPRVTAEQGIAMLLKDAASPLERRLVK